MFGRGAETFTRSIDAEGATSVRAKINMASGRLQLGGGAHALMDGEFTTARDVQPRIDYRVDSGRGLLEIVQPSIPKSLRLPKNEWNIRLGDGIPLDLVVDHAAGESELDTDALSLTSLELDHQAGRSTVNVGGDQPQLAWVDVDIAAGELSLRLTGHYTALRDLRVESAAGKIMLDLTGRFEADLDARIEAAAGQVTIRLPGETSAIVEAQTTIGQVKADGLTRDGHRYHHTVSGSPARLYIRVEASVGQIILTVAE